MIPFWIVGRAASAAAREDSLAVQHGLELAYDEYCRAEIDRHIGQNLSAQDLESAMESKTAELAKQYPALPRATLAEIALGSVRAEIARLVRRYERG